MRKLKGRRRRDWMRAMMPRLELMAAIEEVDRVWQRGLLRLTPKVEADIRRQLNLPPRALWAKEAQA